jgi:hypothetical protein
MSRFATLILLVVLPAIVRAEEPVRERIEWADIWVTDADKNDQPRVLFIGDSVQSCLPKTHISR